MFNFHILIFFISFCFILFYCFLFFWVWSEIWNPNRNIIHDCLYLHRHDAMLMHIYQRTNDRHTKKKYNNIFLWLKLKYRRNINSYFYRHQRTLFSFITYGPMAIVSICIDTDFVDEFNVTTAFDKTNCNQCQRNWSA